MKERVKFALEWEKRWNAGEGFLNFSELCREFGISRPAGYACIERYRAANHHVEALVSQSRRPHTMPLKVSDDVEDALVAARKIFPTWGPKKLRKLLLTRHPEIPMPAQSTIGEILRRRGMTVPRKRRAPRVKGARQPFANITGPNATWCVDFKGHFRTGDRVKVYPLTILDAHSRFLVRCEGLLEPDGRQVEHVFESAFTEFGLPSAMRSDNGPPFASVGAGGLTKLAVGWMRLGIRLERITPGKPQENGRQERFHRTLKAETARPPKAHLRAQQRSFDIFRRIYNEERPHEALGQETPSSVFTRSSRRYPRPLVKFEIEPWVECLRVDRDGNIRWRDKRVFVSTALAHEDVRVDYDGELEHWVVAFGPMRVGTLKENGPRIEFLPTRGRLQDIDWELAAEMASH